MSYLIYIVFGLAPSVIWLLFYLRKDSHPESNKTVLKIFLWGMLIAIPAILIEIGVLSFFKNPETLPALVIYNILGIAFVEEFLKYLVIREKILKNPAFDEPLDVMLYMIIVALGFAALENIGYLLPDENVLPFTSTLATAVYRFLGATFLHALASGIFGYFLALSYFKIRKKFSFFSAGLLIAVFLHGFFNLSIIILRENSVFIVVFFLISLSVLVSFSFKKLKKMASVCKIE